MANTDSGEKSKDDVYEERNLLALGFLAALAEREHYKPGSDGIEMGWWPDTDDVNGDEWAVVWANLFAGDPGSDLRPGKEYGQVGWHIPMEMVPEWLERKDPEYDGYTTEEKNGRVARYVDAGKGYADNRATATTGRGSGGQPL